ncbi:MAG TPA: hypothetical protein ENJ09_04190 [Planctomycetes bacterium]|nr:hypothetical protein [Planctomycetota bacterium]
MKHEIDAEYRFCTFEVGGQSYGINILAVREIHPDLDITTAPGAPAYVDGLINLRGQIVTILDTAAILGKGKSFVTQDSRLVILRNNAELDAKGIEGIETANDVVGFRVDRVTDVVSVHGNEVRSAPATLDGDDDAALVTGVIARGDDLVRVLDPTLLLDLRPEAV